MYAHVIIKPKLLYPRENVKPYLKKERTHFLWGMAAERRGGESQMLYSSIFWYSGRAIVDVKYKILV